MVTTNQTSTYTVVFRADTSAYERGTRGVENANQRLSRSEQQVSRERQRAERQATARRQALGRQGLGVGGQVAGQVGGAVGRFGGLGTSLAGGAAGLGAAGAATAGVGAAVAGIALLGTASVNAARELGTIEGLQLDEDLFKLREQTQLLLAEWGSALIPVIRPVVQGLTDFVQVLRRLNILGEEDLSGQGRAATSFGRNEQGELVLGANQGQVRAPAEFTQQENIARGGIQGAINAVRTGNPQHILYSAGVGATRGAFQFAPGTNLYSGQQRQSPEEIEAALSQPNPYTRSGFRFGGIVGTPAQLDIPNLQAGGIAYPQQGGILARVAEAGQAEVIAPLEDLGRMLGTRRENLKELADQFRFSLDRSQDLPPLESRIAPPNPVTIDGSVDVDIETIPVTTLTQEQYNTRQMAGTLSGFYVIVEA